MSLVPVLVLAAVLGASFRTEARRRGLAEARSEATLLAHAAIEPLLEGHPLELGLNPSEKSGLSHLSNRALLDGSVLRLRLRDLDGRVVFSDDGSGLGLSGEDDEVEGAVEGRVIALLTRLNADANDDGPRGPAAAEVYTLLRTTGGDRSIGVLELYLPYAPIQHDVNAGLSTLYRSLALGLGALYIVLFVIAASVSKGLRRESARNAFLAEHDALTELPNRTLFRRRVEAAVNVAVRNGRATAIAIIDLDRFKEVNDTLGHQNGDLLLKEIAQRLAAHLEAGDTVARLGGDEFGLVLTDVTEPRTKLAELRNVIDREVEVNGLPLSLEASIGFVVAPTDGTDPDELVQRADVAMYLAKDRHRGVVRYDRAHDHCDPGNLALLAEMRTAIDADQLVLHYQPKNTLPSGGIEAVEALVRWQHPVHGLIYPDRFLPLAEQTDLIERLTDWVLRRALVEMKSLGPIAADLPVAVNVSARNLADSDFAERVVAVLHELDVPAGQLTIEITETALLADPARAATVLRELSRIGVRVSLDDFGRGQTSLGYLSALPLHELKIDKSFIADMVANQAHAAIVRSVVDLGHNLSLRVVGEGVETEDILTVLRATGCDVAQGYFFARPMPAAKLRDYLIGVRAAVPSRQAARSA